MSEELENAGSPTADSGAQSEGSVPNAAGVTFARPATERKPIKFGTGTTDGYLPLYALSPTLTITPPGSSPTVVTIQGLLDYQPPGREYSMTTDIPLTGGSTYKNKELGTVTHEKIAKIPVTIIYGAAHRTAIEAAIGVNNCALSLTLIDGSTYVGVGAIIKASETKQGANNTLRTEIELFVNGGWTWTGGSTGNPNA